MTRPTPTAAAKSCASFTPGIAPPMQTPPEPENPAMNMMARTQEVSVQTKAVQTKERLVVVGNGMAGIRTVEEVLQRDPSRYDITVFGAEPHVNYNRIMLS